MANYLTIINDRNCSLVHHADGVPSIVGYAGVPAKTAWRDFFEGIYPNPNTKRSYNTAVRQFCQWCENRQLALAELRAGDIGEYLAEHPGSIATKKVHRAANKKFFDLLVERHVCLINPWAVARTEKYQVKQGKTPRIELKELQQLLASIDRNDPVGKRDHTIIAVFAGCGVRAHAISKLRRGHYRGKPGAMSLRFIEKGGNDDTIAVRHDLEEWLEDYLTFFGMHGADSNMPIFRPFLRKTRMFRDWMPKSRGQKESGTLTPNDVCRMVKRRLKKAGLRSELSAHSFRVNVITDLIEQDIPLEQVQELVGHADARTTKLYDRTRRKATRNLVERIRIK